MIHVYGYCMNAQDKFDNFKNIVFSNVITSVTESLLDTMAQESGADMELLQTCISSEAPYTHIEKNRQLARALQIQRTPTFFVQETQIRTPGSLMEWKNVLQITE